MKNPIKTQSKNGIVPNHRSHKRYSTKSTYSSHSSKALSDDSFQIYNPLSLSVKIFLLSVITIFGPLLVMFDFGLIFTGEKVNKTKILRSEKFQEYHGWHHADFLAEKIFNISNCDIDRIFVDKLTVKEFENIYKFRKPVVIKFRNGASDWTDESLWSRMTLKKQYGHWSVLAGNAREIIRRGGNGDVETSFEHFIDVGIFKKDNLGEPLYVFDRYFYKDSNLPSSLKPPKYFQVQDDVDDSIFFLGSSGSGVSFHKHADAWNAVIFGRKRWFLYPPKKTPPGGVYPGYTMLEWFDKIYSAISDENKPMECIQEAGEMLYLPESTYHGTINIGDTIAIGIQKKEAYTETEKLFYEELRIQNLLSTNVSVQEKKYAMKQKVTIFETLLKFLPDNAEVHMKLGESYISINRLQKALSHLREAIRLDPYFIVAYISLANIHAQLGNDAAAENTFQRAHELNPRLWDVYAQYGDYLLNRNQPEKAAQLFRKGLQLHPNMTAFWYHLMLAQKRIGDEDGAKQSSHEINRLNKYFQQNGAK